MGRNLIETVMGAAVLAVAVLFVVLAYSSATVRAVDGYTLDARFGRVDGLTVGTADQRLQHALLLEQPQRLDRFESDRTGRIELGELLLFARDWQAAADAYEACLEIDLFYTQSGHFEIGDIRIVSQYIHIKG